MDEEFEKSVYSFYFNGLVYLGGWGIYTEDRTKKLLYRLYYNANASWILFMSYMGVLDFVQSISQINKMVYNVCFNIFITGTLIKLRLTAHNYRRIDTLRRNLHRSVSTCRDPEEHEMYHGALKDLNFIVKTFIICLVGIYPLWFLVNFLSDLWGERLYPLPSKWVTEVDINDVDMFILISVFHGVFVGYFLLQAACLDASFFGLLAQLYREYGFLIKRVREFGDFCDAMYREDSAMRVAGKQEPDEDNVYLKKVKVKRLLGEIITRQKDLFQFSEDFEYSYNKTMFVHLFAGGTLVCANGIQTMIVSFEFSSKITYQFAYVSLILFDLLYLCWMVNRISTKCLEVGNAFYGIPWYKLDVDIQKDICLVICRSQKPTRITSGNFVELNLQTSMALLKNIYSWLAMYRQVVLK